MVAPLRRRKPVPPPIVMRMEGYEALEKVAKACATSGRVLVPKGWVGKRVRIVRLDP